MAYSAFDDKSRPPTPAELSAVLGRAESRWQQLKADIACAGSPLAEDWVYGGKNYGWSLRLKQKKRAILYMTPCAACFRVGLAFGEKAVQAAMESDLSEPAKKLIESAPRYVEGRAVRLEIKTARDANLARKLAAIKMAP